MISFEQRVFNHLEVIGMRKQASMFGLNKQAVSMKGIAQGVKKGIGKIKGTAKQFGQAVGGKAKSVGKAIGQGAGKAYDKSVQELKAIRDAITDAIGDAYNNVRDASRSKQWKNVRGDTRQLLKSYLNKGAYNPFKDSRTAKNIALAGGGAAVGAGAGVGGTLLAQILGRKDQSDQSEA